MGKGIGILRIVPLLQKTANECENLKLMNFLNLLTIQCIEGHKRVVTAFIRLPKVLLVKPATQTTIAMVLTILLLSAIGRLASVSATLIVLPFELSESR